jgi:dUTP pyrophosphatase
MIKVKIKKLHPNAVIPKQASELAGGWDVTCTEIIQESADFVICKLGFALQPPPNYKITLVPRSSITKTHWILQNSPGLGDPDYLGEYQYRFRCIPNVSPNPFQYQEFPYNVGDRIGQLYLEEIIPINFIEVEELSDTERGTGGFGSSGK